MLHFIFLFHNIVLIINISVLLVNSASAYDYAMLMNKFIVRCEVNKFKKKIKKI